MGAYNTVRQLIETHQETEISARTLMLAWLQMHINYPGMHPDDYLDTDGPYSGWHAILAHTVFKTTPMDEVMYPGEVWVFTVDTLEKLAIFHINDEDSLYQNMLLELNTFFKDLDVEQLDTVYHHLNELVQFHDGCPEDVFEVLSTVCGMFAFIINL